jgi:hypothetical protein
VKDFSHSLRAFAGTANGGHFIVGAKTTVDGRLVCLDPWYGLVQPPLSTLPAYAVSEDYRCQASRLNSVNGMYRAT